METLSSDILYKHVFIYFYVLISGTDSSDETVLHDVCPSKTGVNTTHFESIFLSSSNRVLGSKSLALVIC